MSSPAEACTDEQWLADLASDDRARQEAAARDLTGFLRGTLARGFGRQLADADLDDLAQAGVLRVMERRRDFRGDSRFTTWAASIAVNGALGELRRRKHQGRRLEDIAAETRAAFETPPEAPARMQRVQAERVLRDAIDRALTDAQRDALLADLGGVPLQEIARRTGRKRGTLYKLMHDARRRLRDHLEAAGLRAEDLLDDPEGGVA